MKIQDIQPGQTLEGLGSQSALATVSAVVPIGSTAVQVYYRIAMALSFDRLPN